MPVDYAPPDSLLKQRTPHLLTMPMAQICAFLPVFR